MDNQPAGIGHNSGDVLAALADIFSATALAEEYSGLAMEVQQEAAASALLLAVDDPESSARAAERVVALRALSKKVDDTCQEVGSPLFEAHRRVTAFFNGLNNTDARKPGVLTRHKKRLEDLIRDHGFRVAAEQRRIAEEAARLQRERLAREAEAARIAEAANKTVTATVLIDEAVKTEQIAEKLEARAEGPVQELARQRTDQGVVGLRGSNSFEIVDINALYASLGPLGQDISLDAVNQALRGYIARAVKAGRVTVSEELIGPRRAIAVTPAIPGVDFFVLYSGSVRA